MAIHVKNLNYIYSEGLPHETDALKDISFDVADGELVGIIGHTGSGKSTLAQQLNGLLKPKSGTIMIGDTDITAKGAAMREVRRHVGLVFQYPEYQLFEETVREDVAFGPKNLGLSEDEIDARVREALSLVGLDYDEVAERSPFELSGGQKRRVAIAGVVAMRPEVLILDEPTAGLDPRAHDEILKMVRRIRRVADQEKNIIILISHNMNDIARMSDRVLVMYDGTIAMTGTPREVFSQRERLKELGLGLPDVTEFTYGLRDSGIDIAPALNADEAEEELFRILSRG